MNSDWEVGMCRHVKFSNSLWSNDIIESALKVMNQTDHPQLWVNEWNRADRTLMDKRNAIGHELSERQHTYTGANDL